MFQVLSPLAEPLPATAACWPFSLPAMFTRSRSTPGTFLSTPQGSRAFGVCWSSALSIVVAVPRRFMSTTGVSAVTVTDSSMVATFMPNVRLTFWPVVTMTSRFTVAKPVRATVSL